MKFQNKEHEDRFFELMEKSGAAATDLERAALFYIIAGNGDLYRKVNRIYNFEIGGINSECLEDGEVDFCSSSRRLVELAYNLFNDFGRGESRGVLDTLYYLDDDNFEIAMTAIRIRLAKEID